jgi:hypothetical protein
MVLVCAGTGALCAEHDRAAAAAVPGGAVFLRARYCAWSVVSPDAAPSPRAAADHPAAPFFWRGGGPCVAYREPETVPSPLAARGCYTFGPVTLRTSDPFGWLGREVTVPLYDTLLVYPLLAPPAAFGLAPLHPSGEAATARHLLEDPLRVMGVRDYQPGDDPRRIHWKATAHAGGLRSKVYEYSNQQRLLLLLDTGNASTLWTALDADMQEFCIAAAASLAVWALDEGYMVGLLTNCAIRTLPRITELSAPGVSVPFACDYGQYEHLLATFARLVPYNTVPLENIIDLGDTLFFPGTTVILVSAAPTLTQATIERLLDLRTRGTALHLVLTGELAEKATPETYDIPVHYLGGREQWHELIKAFVGEKSQGTGTRAVQLPLD